MYGSVQCDVYTHTMYIYACTKGTVCMCTMYSSVQCGAYTHTYIHVLKVECVRVHQQCMVVHSVMHIHIHIYMY